MRLPIFLGCVCTGLLVAIDKLPNNVGLLPWFVICCVIAGVSGLISLGLGCILKKPESKDFNSEVREMREAFEKPPLDRGTWS